MSVYQRLEAHFHGLSALEGAQAILHWDTEVMMPAGSVAVRGEQLAALSGIIHQRLCEPALSDWLAAAEGETLGDWQRANLREMRHHYQHANAVPADLVDALSRATTHCEHVWREARAANDFAAFATAFGELLPLLRESANAKAAALNLSPYDALLDQFDPGQRRAMIEPLFADLETFLPPLIDHVLENQAAHPPVAPAEAIAVEQQEALGRQLMAALGFDFAHGRIDTSAHPFCGGVPGDIRLTTRYREDAFAESLYGVLHETGHALYEMGLPAEWRTQPVGRARGMSLHESQSLFIEMQLALSRDFLTYLAPLLRTAFAVSGPAWEDDNLHRYLTQVERGFIRVNADELTYPLHIILRYRLEQALLSGDLPVDELPGAWNDLMQHYLGITPPDMASGCLQDVHWAGGAIGYFPTYTLGAMIAAQLFDSAAQALPDLPQQLARGEFAPLISWLQHHVHALASYHPTPALITKATGQDLNVELYKAHLQNRYAG